MVCSCSPRRIAKAVLVACFFNFLAFSLAQETLPPSSVTVLGLGYMGTAILKCLAKHGVQVHAWNRGAEKREAVQDVASVYETAAAAVQASNVTLVLIDDWEGSVKLIRDIDKLIWKDRTVILFSTYTPTDIQQLQADFFDESRTLVGGAIVGVPQTICSQKALILTTADVPVLNAVGRLVSFTGDVGLAALANMALILVITFGVAGQELAHLIIEKFGVDEQFLEIYAPLSAEIGPDYLKMLLPMVSKSIMTKEYEQSYVPAGVFQRVLQMHATFMNDLGIADDTFLAAYLQYLDRIPNKKFGPASWIEQAILKVSRDKDDVTNEDEL